MTVDRKRKLRCKWCGGITNNYEAVYSDLTHEAYCCRECKDEAELNKCPEGRRAEVL